MKRHYQKQHYHEMRRKQRARSVGFSLIELLLAFVLITVVSTSLYLSLRSGLVLYKRSEEGLKTTNEVILFLDTLSYELRNAFYYSALPFEGTEESIYFPTVITAYQDGTPQTGIYTIRYMFKSKKLVREEDRLGTQKDKQHKRTVMYPALQKLTFQYGFYDSKAKELSWKTAWPGETLGAVPHAIALTMVVRYTDSEGNTIRDKRLEKKIWIPHGTWGG